MKIKVLGSSSAGNCYLLEGEKETLIVECGVDTRSIIKGLNFNLSNVVGCLLSHEHKDHSKYINSLIKKGIDIYSSPGTFEALQIDKIKNHRVKYVFSEKAIRIGSFTVLPFGVQHDAAEPLGFLIQHSEMGKLLFITDSYYCKYSFNNLDHVLIECNYSNEILEQRDMPKSLKTRIIKSHFELGNVKDFLRAIDLSAVKNIMLIHLSDGNSNAAQFEEDIEKLTGKPVYVADKGLELELEG